MYKNGNNNELELFAKNKQKEDLEVNMFATLSGIKGTQFGKEVFATVVKFKDLKTFLEVFPEVQRDINRRKIGSIKTYILSGLTNLKETMRFFPSITVTARGHVYYDEASKQIAIDTNKSKLSVNDGQHRFVAVNEAIRELSGKLNKATDKMERVKIANTIDTLEEMMLPMTIFNNLTEREEKQLFHDTNNLAQRPSRSATIKLAQTDLFSVLARELAEENRYLKYYGVEMDKTSIMKVNPNTILLTTVHEFARRLIWDLTNKGRSSALEGRYEEMKVYVSDTLDMVFKHLPADLNAKGKYIIEKNYTLKGIAKYIHDCRFMDIPDKYIFDVIAEINWTADIEYWKQYGGHETKTGLLSFGGAEHGRMAIYEALISNLPFNIEDSEAVKEVSASKSN